MKKPMACLIYGNGAVGRSFTSYQSTRSVLEHLYGAYDPKSPMIFAYRHQRFLSDPRSK
jgi:hypothetical protein